MGHDRTAPKSRVNMTLDADLVREARALTPNLSETVERLLTAFVAEGRAERERRQQAIDRHVAASNAFLAAHGTLADEFQTL